MVLKYRTFKRDVDEGLPAIITSSKVYGDFRRLHEFVRCSQLKGDDGKPEPLPLLPSKLERNGLKKQDQEMTRELESYMRELLRVPKVARMIYVRHFFIMGEVNMQRPTQTTDQILTNLISPDTEMDF